MSDPTGIQHFYSMDDTAGGGGGPDTGGGTETGEGGSSNSDSNLDPTIGGEGGITGDIPGTGSGEGSGEGSGSGSGTGTGSGGGSGGGGTAAAQVDIFDRTISVPSIVADYTDEELNREYHAKVEYEEAINKYGAIFKVLNFSDVDDVNLMKRYAKEWIRRNYYDGVLSFTVKAVDLHLLGYNTDKIKCGDYIPIEFLDLYKVPVTKKLTCMSVQYDLFHPENDSYKIGIPDVSAEIKYRESLSTTSTSSYSNANNNANSPGGLSKFMNSVKEMAMAQAKTALEKFGLDINNTDI